MLIFVWIAVVTFVFASFLAVRFINPEIFYTLRNRLLNFHYEVSILRSMEQDGGYEINDAGSYLMRDLRTYSQPKSVEEGLKRVVKVRQLYECLDVERRRSDRQDDFDQSYACIQELSLVIHHLAENIVPDRAYTRSIIGADQILGLLAQSLEGRNTDTDEEWVQDYWTKAPMGVEQLTELQAACVFAIAYRVNSQALNS